MYANIKTQFNDERKLNNMMYVNMLCALENYTVLYKYTGIQRPTQRLPSPCLIVIKHLFIF